MERQTSRSPVAHLQSAAADKPYVPHDVIGEVIRTAGMAGTAGLFAGGVRNAQARTNAGLWGFVTNQKGVIGLITAAPTMYTFVKGTYSNLNGADDIWGTFLGGFAAGGVVGASYKRFPVMMGMGAAFGTVMSTMELFGGRIDSFKQEDDEFDRKEVVRRTTRVPIEQTIAEIGEGRGIRPEGYQERRRERIKEKFGIEIETVPATVDGSE